MELQGTLNSQTIPKKKNKVGGLTVLDFKTNFKVMLIKTVLCWHESRPVNQWDRIKSTEIILDILGDFIFDKAAKNIPWGK